MDVGAALAASPEVPADRGPRPAARTVRITRAPGGHPPGLGEARELVGDLRPQAGDGPPPPHGVRIDDPRRVLAEAPQLEVRGGHGRPSLAPRAIVQVRRGRWTMIYRCRCWRRPRGAPGGRPRPRRGGHPRVPPLTWSIAPGITAVGHRVNDIGQTIVPLLHRGTGPGRWPAAARRGRLRTSLVPARRRRGELGHRPGRLDLVRGGARPGGALPGPRRRRLPGRRPVPARRRAGVPVAVAARHGSARAVLDGLMTHFSHGRSRATAPSSAWST